MAGASFPKRVRLLEPAQFRAVFDGATQRLPAGEILLLARENALSHPRLGIVIGRKVSPLARHRNGFKRLVRESFRLEQQRLPPLDIIVLARRGIADLDHSSIRQRITGLWTRLLKRSAKAAMQGSTAASP